MNKDAPKTDIGQVTIKAAESHYKDALDYLDDEYAYFLTQVLNIGKPEWNGAIPTACVAIPMDVSGDLSDFRYIFNPSFAMALSKEELGFVAAHECMHIVLNHLRLGKSFDNPQLFNIAADACINDFLASQALHVPEWVIRGEKVVGFDCSNATVTQVYAALKNLPEQPEVGEAGEGSGEGEGNDNGSLVDDHSWIHDSSQTQDAQADKAKDEAEKRGMPSGVSDVRADDHGEERDNVVSHGMGQGAQSMFTEDKSVTMEWAKLLKKLNPDVFKGGPPQNRAAWDRRPRKLMGPAFKDVILPVYKRPYQGKKGEIPSIVLALDTSGSIDRRDANRFVNLARSIPQSKIKLFACTFTTQYTPLDLENPVFHDGGTCFSAIESFIQKEVITQLKHYPKSVVVVTDGAANWYGAEYPEPENHDRWLWLATPRCRQVFNDYAKHYAQGGRPQYPGSIEDLTDFCNL